MTKVPDSRPAEPTPEEELDEARRDEEALSAEIDDLETRTSPPRPKPPPIGSMF
jgi:hypothetical protein